MFTPHPLSLLTSTQRQQPVLQDVPGICAFIHQVQLGDDTDCAQTWVTHTHVPTMTPIVCRPGWHPPPPSHHDTNCAQTWVTHTHTYHDTDCAQTWARHTHTQVSKSHTSSSLPVILYPYLNPNTPKLYPWLLYAPHLHSSRPPTYIQIGPLPTLW